MKRAMAWFHAGDRWIPGLFIAAFLLLFAVNGRMVWIAFANRPDIVTAQPLPAGTERLAIAYDGEAGQAAPVLVTLTDSRGQPIRDARVHLVAERTSRYAQLIRLPLVTDGSGYRGMLALPLGGEWVLTAHAETADGPIEARRSVTVRPGRGA